MFIVIIILYVLADYLYSDKKRRNIILTVSGIIAILSVIFNNKIRNFGFFFTPLIFSLEYILIRNIYVSELKREPVIPNRFGFFNYEYNRYPDGADFLFMVIVLFIPTVLSLLINFLAIKILF